MGRNSRNKRFNTANAGNPEQNRMTRSLDSLIEYDAYCESIAPKLRKMLEGGKTAQEIYAWAQSVAAAKAVSLINNDDAKVALQAVKEVLDRGVGKPADTVNITSRYESLTDEQLEILLKSQRDELEELDQASKH